MKKRLFKVFFVLFLCIISVIPAFAVSAADDMPRLVDRADLLSESEEADLLNKLNEISERQRLDVVVVTVISLEGKTATEYSDDFYDYNGYGFGNTKDGILLLVSKEDRDWSISTRGYGITAFTDAGIDYISKDFLQYLSKDNYKEAFTAFAEQCDRFITQAKTGNPYDAGNLPKEPFGIYDLLLALIIGFVISLIVTGIMRLQLSSVYGQRTANDYIKSGSMNVTRSTDLFLYRHINRIERPKNENVSSPGGSTTHTSSSGATHGGKSGKF